jgi:parallel beta-helix repeat protein
MKFNNCRFQLKIASILLCTLASSTNPALAAVTKYAVGTCQPKLQQFPTITAAVNAVPPYSTILVCPGTYPEQINLYQPVTLQGVGSGNSNRAIITVPAGGMTENAISIDVGTLYTQVVVSSTGVNISNLTVDGSNNNINGAAFLVGIFYQAASSGTVNGVTARNQIDSGMGSGIWLENGTSTPETITVENSVVHDVDLAGICASGSNLTATIKNNSLQSGFYGLLWDASSGLATGNLTNSPIGIRSDGSGTFSGNTILNASSAGVYVGDKGANIFTGNKIFHSAIAFVSLVTGQTFQSNVITNSNVAIHVACMTGNVISRNTINDAVFGLYSAPSTFTGPNTFLNVDTVRSEGCNAAQTGLAALALPRLRMPHSR